MVLCSLTLPFWKNPLKKSHFIIFMFAKINIDGILSRVAKHYSLTMSLPQTELLHRQSSSHLWLLVGGSHQENRPTADPSNRECLTANRLSLDVISACLPNSYKLPQDAGLR